MLLETHPRLGRAAFAARWEQDLAGDYPGQRVLEVLDLKHEHGRCARCGAPEHRITTDERLLVGCNAGLRCRHYWLKRSCKHASGSSNYRAPWKF